MLGYIKDTISYHSTMSVVRSLVDISTSNISGRIITLQISYRSTGDINPLSPYSNPSSTPWVIRQICTSMIARIAWTESLVFTAAKRNIGVSIDGVSFVFARVLRNSENTRRNLRIPHNGENETNRKEYTGVALIHTIESKNE